MSNYRAYQENKIQMLTVSTRFYLLYESANPISILYKSSAEAPILIILLLISARGGEGLVPYYAVRRHRVSSSRTRFSLPCAHPDFFAVQLVANRSSVHHNVASAHPRQALPRPLLTRS